MPLYTPYANALEPQRDANLACGMSMLLPGLGQLYNKEKRKALFFMATGCLNYLLLLLIILAPQIMQSLKAFGALNQFRLNQALVLSLEQLQLGSGACFALISLFIGFSMFAARDAYDRAQCLRRAAIYRDYVVGMPETTSGSYIFHISLLLACFVLAFFFLIPAPPQSQITDIEFKQAEENTKEVQKTNNRAENNSKAGGKRDFSRSSSISSSSSRSSRSSVRQAQVSAQAQSASALPSAQSSQSSLTSAPIPQPTLQRMAQSILQPKPVSTSPLSATPSFTPSQNLKTPISNTPLPVVPLVASSALPALAIPRPSLAIPSSSAPSNLNLPKLPVPSLGQGSGADVRIASVPRIAASSGASGGPVMPLPVGMHSGNGSRSVSNNNGASGSAPAPSRSGLGNGPSGPSCNGSAVVPSLSRQGPGPGSQQGQSKIGNGDLSNPDTGEGKEGLTAVKDVDFGPYMAELQRRIKRAWFPPKDARSKRVKVIFKVHRNGEITNLRLANSSGLTAADEAALKAIQTAAPFHPLPAGAPVDVDIEFTFDYNVFNGGGTGSFRGF
jgi:TonB family protein